VDGLPRWPRGQLATGLVFGCDERPSPSARSARAFAPAVAHGVARGADRARGARARWRDRPASERRVDDAAGARAGDDDAHAPVSRGAGARAAALASPATSARGGEDRRVRASPRIRGSRRTSDRRGVGWPRAAARARGPALERSRFERPAVRVSTARPRHAGQVNDAVRPLAGRDDSDRGVAIMFNLHRPPCAMAHAPS